MKPPIPAWLRLFSGIRFRILLLCVAIMTGLTGISILAVRQLMSLRSEEQSKRLLLQEIEELQSLLLYARTYSIDGIWLSDQMIVLLRETSARLPNTGSTLVTQIEQTPVLLRLIQPSPQPIHPRLRQFLPKVDLKEVVQELQQNPQMLKRLANLKSPTQLELDVGQEAYRVWLGPIWVTRGSATRIGGVLIVLQSLAEERLKVDEVTLVLFQVMLVVLAVSCVFAWGFAARVVTPLRLLRETAQSITASNVSQRIAIGGADEIAELTQTFNEMLDRLETALTSQREFLNDAGHELRTPITIIQGHLELLGDDPQERQETINLVTDELNRMSRLVDDLLLLARAERPDFLMSENLNVQTFLEELFTKVKALGDRQWQLQSRATGALVADRQRLTQAVMNLVNNAVQHTKVGDQIILSSQNQPNCIAFTVQDSGPGIDRSDQQRIFRRFARVGSKRRRSEGAGLGLSIAQAIVHAHGGTITLVSELGQGAAFTIHLPLLRHKAM